MSMGLWSRLVAKTGTNGPPLVPFRATRRDQRPVQTNRPLPALVTTTLRNQSIALTSIASYRRAREPPAALWNSIVFTSLASSHLPLSTIYSTHIYDHLKHTPHSLILIFFFPKTQLPRITTTGALSLPLNGGAISTSISALLRHH
jgi:hypothetical protein